MVEGEVFQLVFSGDHAQGCIFKDGTAKHTQELLARIHDIALRLPEFYFGRFDIRYHSDEAFFKGEAFQIVEVNGAGSEATNIWDPDMDLLTAYSILFKEWSLLFEIGAINRRRGFKPMGSLKLARELMHFKRRRESYSLAK